MRWHWLTLAGSGLLGACTSAVSPAPPIHPAPVVHEEQTYATGDPPAPQATRTLFERPPIQDPGKVGCRFELPRWDHAGYDLELYLGVGKAAWGRLSKDAKVSVSIAIEDGYKPGVVDFEQSGVTIRSVVHPDQLRLRPRRARVLSGFAVPLSTRKLSVEAIVDGSAEVSFYLGLDFESQAWLRTKYSCQQMTLDTPTFVPKVAKAAKKTMKYLAAGRAVALRASPGGTEVAKLEPRHDLWVDVIEQHPGHARIRWEDGELLFFGWVDDKALREEAQGLLGMLGGLGLRGVGEGGDPKLPRPLPVRCRGELPLVVWQRGHARTVGTIGPKARFVPSVVLGELRAIEVRNLDIELRDGSFYTLAADIPRLCSTVAEPR